MADRGWHLPTLVACAWTDLWDSLADAAATVRDRGVPWSEDSDTVDRWWRFKERAKCRLLRRHTFWHPPGEPPYCWVCGAPPAGGQRPGGK